jgi:carbon monoxide dehydrogenase subunit G
MNLQGSYRLPARPRMVWAALQDPAVLSACIPGSEGVTKVSAGAYQGQAAVAVGPMKLRFAGRLVWTEHPAPDGFTHAATLSGEGQAGVAGAVHGECELRLTQGADADSAVLTYEAKNELSGKIAQLGEAAIEAAAKSLADEFFAAFASLIRRGMARVPNVPHPAPAPPQAPIRSEVEKLQDKGETPPAPAPRKNATRRPEEVGLKSQIWLVGLVGIVILLLFFFSIVLGA